jgi:SAM-dependent methyltransferase
MNMGLQRFFSKQARMPTGWFGRWVMSVIFDKGNAVLNDFVKELLSLRRNDHVLEIGFGTGKLIREMAQSVDRGRIEGIDFSATMADMAARRNRRNIAMGRVKIEHGDFEKAAYPENRFDKVCSTNTIYFWPDPENCLRRIGRILKPGGMLVLAFEDSAQLQERSLSSDVFRIYKEDDIQQLILESGFSICEIKSKRIGSLTYHCAVGVKGRPVS